MKKLTIDQVLAMHKQVVAATGGSADVRDLGLLESAMEAPFQTFDNQELYPTIQAKAARLAFGIIKNHPMVDGNKRIGIHAALVFLAINGIELCYEQKELYSIVLDVAAGRLDEHDLYQWIMSHLK